MSAKAMMPSSQLAHRLTMKETKRTGTTVSHDVVREYMAALGPAYVPVCVALGLVAYGLMAATDLWLAGWITAAGEGEGAAADRAKAYGYIGLAVAQVAGILALSAWNAFSTNRASRELHRKCVGRILHAPVKWFEENPSGRILSRFSGDLSIVDRMFAFLVDDAWHFVWLIVGLCAVIAVIVPEMVAVLVAGLFLAALCVVAVDRTNREAKRETNMALSPILTTISETVHGRALLQSMGLQDFFCRRNYRNLDTFNGLNFFSCCVIQFGTLRINVLAFFITTATASLVLLRRDAFDDVALIGVALSYSFLLPYFMGIFMVIITQLMSGASSLERLLEYLTASLPQEAAWTTAADPDTTGPAAWPSAGAVAFNGVALRYREGLPLAVKDATFSVRGGEKVGVVGRTGAGKSSLVLLLFRLVEAAGGAILVDGKLIADMGLQTLRRALAIVPQTPLLIQGSIRHNLDPFGTVGDAAMVEALRRVELGGAAARLDDSAGDLSAGEKQLLALARVLLRPRDRLKLLVLDEPTANIDSRTDEVLQSVIREEFAACTTLTIAHRLNTIIDSDQVLVMDDGRVAEFGAPLALLRKDGGALRGMVDALGPAAAEELAAKAKTAQVNLRV